MDIESVPQEGNATLGGHRKAIYARDAHGRFVIIPSRGWEAEEIVTCHAVDAFRVRAEAVRQRVAAGTASPLEYWMHERRMDPTLLSQASGFWQWRVRRHLRPSGFAGLSAKQIEAYAQALGLSVAGLRQVPL